MSKTKQTSKRAGHSTEECAYCAAVVARRDDVPALGDDDSWADLAEEHADYCEWILTRAHRLDCSVE